MTDKQRQFAESLLRSGDGNAALQEAGYLPPWTLERVLGLEQVRAYLSERMVADETEVAAFFSAVMRGEVAADEKLPGVKDQLKAAELLGKYFGMFKEREGKSIGETVEFIGDEMLED